MTATMLAITDKEHERNVATGLFNPDQERMTYNDEVLNDINSKLEKVVVAGLNVPKEEAIGDQ